ncbi:MAG: biopolymer transporter ExbD [Bacteroidota bacterium]|nr:biopolymer transporter ExbD [Bacteroidota bacterium]
MPKVKVARKSTALDMAPMCDVGFLLLTFLLLTSTFIKKEAVQVATPKSTSEIKISEKNVLQILVDNNGKVFIGLDKQADRATILEKVGEKYGLSFTAKQIKDFSLVPSFGVPTEKLKAYLDLPAELRDMKENALGIPADSLNNQFKDWVKAAREINPDLIIAIKADQKTPYPKIKNVMSTLQDLRENRYHLITSLEEAPKGL